MVLCLCPDPGSEPVQHVYNIRGHVPAHLQQLRRAVLRDRTNAPGL